ncbi:hypothetical protein ACIPLR_26455 [Herbaspirillum huttiense]|uniref:hypothetical protein n=1 Tax=Herbaspirillum huttiense TaxID=863372 RepID=UPI003818157A
MTKQYDSKAEAEAAPLFERYGCIRCDSFLPATFLDKEGAEFRAKADFYHPATGIYIEYKSAVLNSTTTKRTAANKLESQRRYRGGTLAKIDELKYSWSHSAYKQGLVQEELGPDNFIIVFKDAIAGPDMDRYLKRGIVAITLKSLPTWLAYQQLSRKGLAVGFKLIGDSPLTYNREHQAYV